MQVRVPHITRDTLLLTGKQPPPQCKTARISMCYVLHCGYGKKNYFHVTLRIIGRIFLRGIWHIDAHFNPNDHKAYLRIDQLFSLLLLAPVRILTLLVR
jgi:hypothetical protein